MIHGNRYCSPSRPSETEGEGQLTRHGGLDYIKSEQPRLVLQCWPIPGTPAVKPYKYCLPWRRFNCFAFLFHHHHHQKKKRRQQLDSLADGPLHIVITRDFAQINITNYRPLADTPLGRRRLEPWRCPQPGQVLLLQACLPQIIPL